MAVARKLIAVSPSAVTFTKLSLNNWYRTAGPAFDASLAFEFYGFGMPDAAEGVSALREKRPANFTGPQF
jgi:enoyl-CoA hydratase